MIYGPSAHPHVDCERDKCDVCGKVALVCEMVPSEDREKFACRDCFDEMEPGGGRPMIYGPSAPRLDPRDAAALRSDWQAVGDDLRRAIAEVGDELDSLSPRACPGCWMDPSDHTYEQCPEWTRPITWSRHNRAPLWPLLAFVFVVALFASALTLVGSALVSTRQVDMVAPAPKETTTTIMPGPEASAVRAIAPSVWEAVPAPAFTTSDSTAALKAVPVDRAHLDSGSDGGSGTRTDQTRVGAVSRYSSTWETEDGAILEPRGGGSPAADVSGVSVTEGGGAIERIIRAAALGHGVDPDVMLNVARCESGPDIDVNAIGDGGLALGPFQFHTKSFMWLSRISGLGYELRDVADVEAQADVAAWAFANGWAHLWSCAR